ncbi:HU family DNA-binding protein [Burkholderia ubonensis]|uniref:HU family DNA-binding protein n=1 Tax=Burkholderia ubonensis TaxID=101571 RepID=UPI0009B362B3
MDFAQGWQSRRDAMTRLPSSATFFCSRGRSWRNCFWRRNNCGRRCQSRLTALSAVQRRGAVRYTARWRAARPRCDCGERLPRRHSMRVDVRFIEQGRLMNKQERIDAVVADAGLSKTAAGEAIQGRTEHHHAHHQRGRHRTARRFWLVLTRQRAARTGRNPTTGAEIAIAAAKTMKFTAGKAFKYAVNAP